MSNYQRLISYIYTYESGLKGKNVGFAKLETRNSQCRLTVNVKKVVPVGSPLGVYLLSGDGEQRIGTLFSRNGTGEFRALLNADRVEGSGRPLQEFFGLSIHEAENAGHSYTTIWEDAAMNAAEAVKKEEKNADRSQEKLQSRQEEERADQAEEIGPESEAEEALEKQEKEAGRPEKEEQKPEAEKPEEEEEEITASTGYDLDENTYSVTVVKDQTVRANSNETPGNDPIGIEVVKNDAETKGIPQGDATLEGAEFTVKYYDGYYTKDDLPKKATRTWVIATKEVTYSTGKKGYVARLSNSNKVSGDNFYTDENGAITLPLGTISIEETKAPKGYLLKGNTLNVTDNLTGVTTTEKDTNYVAQITKEYQGAKLQFGNDANQMVVTEKVKKQKIQIFKSGYRNGMSEVVKGLQGAEFTFKLKSEVDHVGWDNATVYDTITTGEDGWAITKELPYGEYLVRETVTPKDFYTNPDFTVSVTQDTSEIKKDEDKVKKVILNNRPVETQLKLVKQDEETGKTVSLNSASFKIVADEDILDGGNVVYKKGQYITQKVGGKKYDTFTTNSDNVVVVKTEYTNDDDEKGGGRQHGNGDVAELFKAGGSYIVNPDINAAKTIIDMFSKSVVTFCLGNIESFIINFAILRKLFGCFLQFLFVAGTDGNLGSLFEKCFCCCETDAFAASGYND